MTSSRRDFLKTGLTGTTLLASGVTIPGFLARTAHAAPTQADGRILVIVQLSGGNDGLNTVIPYRDDAYHRARPSLRVEQGLALALNDDLALHPEMIAMRRLYDEGMLSVVSNVGYPNPDRSHFRSMDIWHTASLAPEDADRGWLGRVCDDHPEQSPFALHLDADALPLALKSHQVTVPSIRSIDAFRLREDSPELRRVLESARENATDDLLYVQRLAVESCKSARRIASIDRPDSSSHSYPSTRLASRLREIAELIGAGFAPRVYYTSLGGFDTHANQALTHPRLVRELSDAISAFLGDLKGRGLADRVMVMTFSEFGRRVRENGSRGTDHGAAAPMFLAGPSLQRGVFGSPPDLVNTPAGDVIHEIDFRRVYASVLEQWLGVSHEPILGKRYEPLDLVRA